MRKPRPTETYSRSNTKMWWSQDLNPSAASTGVIRLRAEEIGYIQPKKRILKRG